MIAIDVDALIETREVARLTLRQVGYVLEDWRWPPVELDTVSRYLHTGIVTEALKDVKPKVAAAAARKIREGEVGVVTWGHAHVAEAALLRLGLKAPVIGSLHPSAAHGKAEAARALGEIDGYVDDNWGTGELVARLLGCRYGTGSDLVEAVR